MKNYVYMIKKISKWVIVLIITAISVYLLRVLIIDIYIVPSDSMNNAIVSGDYIVVQKVAPSMSRNDIYVFKSPKNWNVNLVKRCVGLPGDTLEIKNTVIYINNKPLLENSDIYQVYKSVLTYPDLKKVIPIDMKGYQILSMRDTSQYVLNDTEVKQVRLTHGNSSIELDNNKRYLTNYGPAVIPYKGMIYYSNNPNPYYSSAIKQIDAIELTKGKGSYIFQQDFYFFLGDNRPYSEDSRTWGFVPEQSIVGRATYIAFSKEKIGINWDRLFNKL